jgi:hypothetical protein
MKVLLSMQLCSKNVLWIDVTDRVAVCEASISILQTFREGSVSLVCAI